MNAKMYHEIFKEFEACKKPQERIDCLRKYGSLQFKEMLNFVFNPGIKFDITEIPEYKVSPLPEGLNDLYLHQVIPRLYVFIPVHTKYKTKLQPRRAQGILIQFLEGLHKDEAKILEKIVTKKLDVKFLTAKCAKDAFPDLPY